MIVSVITYVYYATSPMSTLLCAVWCCQELEYRDRLADCGKQLLQLSQPSEQLDADFTLPPGFLEPTAAGVCSTQ